MHRHRCIDAETDQGRNGRVSEQDGVEGVELVDALQAPATDSDGTAQGEEVDGTASSLLYRIKFQTFFLTHLAVLQSSIACFPYESWRLSPCDNGTGAVLSLALRCGWQVLHVVRGVTRGPTVSSKPSTQKPHHLRPFTWGTGTCRGDSTGKQDKGASA